MRKLSTAAALGAALEIVDFSAYGTTLAYSNIALFPDGKRRVVSIANRANVNRNPLGGGWECDRFHHNSSFKIIYLKPADVSVV
jgi:hypothetical protein